MSYADIVATFALFAALVSLGWQVYTWREQKNREETPQLKVGLRKKRILASNGKVTTSVKFAVENVGNCGVTILSCKINNKSIDEFLWIIDPQNILGAKLEPKNILCCNYAATNIAFQEIPLGSPIQIKYKADSGKTFDKEYTLSLSEE